MATTTRKYLVVQNFDIFYMLVFPYSKSHMSVIKEMQKDPVCKKAILISGGEICSMGCCFGGDPQLKIAARPAEDTKLYISGNVITVTD